jgi:hypothetical protein
VVMLVVYHLYQQRPCTVTQASMPSLRRRSLMRSLGSTFLHIPAQQGQTKSSGRYIAAIAS